MLITLINLYVSLKSLSPQHDAPWDCKWRKQPPDMEGSCKYIEYAVADSWHNLQTLSFVKETNRQLSSGLPQRNISSHINTFQILFAISVLMYS